MEDLVLIGDKYKLTIPKKELDKLIIVLYESCIDSKVKAVLENNK